MALILLGVGAIVCGTSIAFIGWSTESLREERAAMKAAIHAEEAMLTELQSQTWGLELVSYGDGTRGILLPKGTKIDRTGTIKDGREAVVIKP